MTAEIYCKKCQCIQPVAISFLTEKIYGETQRKFFEIRQRSSKPGHEGWIEKLVHRETMEGGGEFRKLTSPSLQCIICHMVHFQSCEHEKIEEFLENETIRGNARARIQKVRAAGAGKR